MKRTGFRPRTTQREHRDPDRLRSVPTVTPGAFRAPQAVAEAPTSPVTKTEPVRSEAYRRAVASLPCIHCKVPGYSQCAHSNTGKGAGIKASDLDSFPLCCDRAGKRGCHSHFDQGGLFAKEMRRLIEPAWVADTQRQIHAMGLWPKNLPYPGDTQAA